MTDYTFTTGVLDNMLYGLVTFTAKSYGEIGKPCVACYSRKRLPTIAPVHWSLERNYDKACSFMCIMWYMALEPKAHSLTNKKKMHMEVMRISLIMR